MDIHTVVLDQKEVAALEAEMQEQQGREHFSGKFLLVPDDEEKNITIMPCVPGDILRLNINEAEVLTKVIQDQILKWI